MGRYKVEAHSRSGVPFTVGRRDNTKDAIKIAELHRLTTNLRAKIFDTKEKKYLAY